MKKSLLSLSILTFLMLTSCGGKGDSSSDNSSSSEEPYYSLAEMSSLLSSSLINNEIAKSNKVIYKEVYTKKEASIQTTEETWNIYNGYKSYASGREKIEYVKENRTINYPYQKVIEMRNDATYDSDLLFYVTDYEMGNSSDGKAVIAKNDSAYILNVVSSGGDSDNGTINRSEVRYQLSKQVSLIASNFIKSQFINNASVSNSLPAGHKVSKDGVDKYFINNFGYGYREEDINIQINIEFSFEVKDEKLLNFNYTYTQIETREDDSYEINQDVNYEINYEDREDAPTTIINPEDYFLSNVSESHAYYFNDNMDKVYCELDELPCDKNVFFEAKKYSPEKAVDLTLYPSNENPTSDEKIICVEGSNFKTVNEGIASLKVYTYTGISLELKVKVLPVKLEQINYTDVRSGIEHSNEKNYVYTNKTYTDILITLTPAKASYQDIDIVVDHPEIAKVTVEKIADDHYMELTYTINDANEGDTFTVTFSSKTSPDISLSKTYICKKSLSGDEVTSYLLSHTYQYSSPYSDLVATLTFTSATTGHIVYVYTDDDNTQKIEESDFSFIINETTFTPEMTSDKPLYQYNEGKILLDLSEIVLDVIDEDGSTILSHHVFKVVK